MSNFEQATFLIENRNSNQSLAEMELWPPEQGTPEQLVPLDIELRFDKHVIRKLDGDLTVALTGAEIELVLEGFQVARGSRFGDVINEPYEVAEITQSIRTDLESETDIGLNIDVTVSKNPIGRVVGYWKKRRKSKRAINVDNVAKIAVRAYRVVARNNNRWSVLEPRSPHILTGRYLGERDDSNNSEKYTPLCLLTKVSSPAIAKIFLRTNYSSIQIVDHSDENQSGLSKNKQAVISQIVRLSLSRSENTASGIQETPQRDSALLACSTLSCQDV